MINQHYCEAIFTGKIVADETAPTRLVFISADDDIIRAAPLAGVAAFTPIPAQWRVVPLTSSGGEISRFQIVEQIDDDDLQVDGCRAVGVVLQVAKKKRIATLEIDRGTAGALMLTFTDVPADMAAGETWEVLAHLDGGRLVVEAATKFDEVNSSVVGEKAAPSKPNPAANPKTKAKPASIPAPRDDYFTRTLKELMPIAQIALMKETNLGEWQLSLPRVRGNSWQWDGETKATANGQIFRARVVVNARTELAQVLVFGAESPELPAIELVERDKLIVTPLGAARSIGASCFRVEIGPYELVLDAGTRPKGSNPLPDFDRITNPNLILITHAHQDHIGALPVLHRKFGAAPMICSEGTREIAEIMLTDCLKVQELNEDFEPLFNDEDLNSTLFHIQTQSIGIDFYPLPGLKVRFINAGHIVGAVCIYLEYGDRSLLYTGDYNTTSSRTTEGLKLAELPKADILITESTYGTGTHPSRRAQETELLTAMAEVVQSGGNVLIPAFALGRAQEIILAIRTSALFHSMNVPIYVDGLVRPITNIFQDNLRFLPKAVKNSVKTGGRDPFFDPRAIPNVMPIGSPQERPLAIAQPSVIIASSGMMTGGASVYYGKLLLERENAAIFISGYTDEESPGRLLQGLEPGTEIELDGTKLTVRAQIRKFNLSAHADRVGLTQVIHRVSPRHLVLIHGSPDALNELSKAGDLREKYWIHIPRVGDEIVCGQPPEHLSVSQLAKLDAPQEFEIDVEAEFDGAWLRVPESVLEDPRWQKLTATGTMTAQWSKSGLVLKATNYKAGILDTAMGMGIDCCAICQFFDGRNCRSEESPLYGRDVDPTTKCQEFIRHETPVVTVTADPETTDEEEDFDLLDLGEF
jgi:Cft2 family RNA processing exonuclease